MDQPDAGTSEVFAEHYGSSHKSEESLQGKCEAIWTELHDVSKMFETLHVMYQLNIENCICHYEHKYYVLQYMH